MRIEHYINQESMALLKREILEAEGAEVFAIGKTKRGVVVSVEVLGRGNDMAAPIVDRDIRGGMAIIHNHPSGKLKPSAADIKAASYFEERGTGFFIINNDVSKVFVVVEPKKEVSLEEEEIIPFFLPEGPLASSFPQYEHREEQQEMVLSIMKAFNEDEHLLVEAATGTGKSWAYLLPSIFWAEKGEGPVIISTNTINLQQQLLTKDIPALKRLLPFSFKAVLMMGRGNYLCLRQLQYWQSHLEREGDELEKMELSRLQVWASKTRRGVRTELSPPLESDVWSKVSSEGDRCLHDHCFFHKRCFFQENRREAADANLIIINHHLFFSDLSLRTSLEEERSLIIPEHNYTIFDEAHNLEDVATRHLGLQITIQIFLKVLDTLQGKKRNGLIFLLRGRLETIFTSKEVHLKAQKELDGLYPLMKTLREQALSFVEKGDRFYQSQGGRKNEAVRLGPWVEEKKEWVDLFDVWEDFKEGLSRLSESLYRITRWMKNHGSLEEGLEDRIEMASCQRRIDEFTSSLQVILTFQEEETVFWMEKQREDLYFMAAPLNVGVRLKEYLFNLKSSVILTSATLTVNKRFDFLRSTLGLTSSEDTSELCLSSPFDFQRQALVLIPEDLPLPTERDFVASAASFTVPLLHELEGRTLFLFTSYHMLNSFYFAIRPQLKKKGIITLSQGQVGRREMVETFKSKRKAVILGTASFWEGVDIPGEDLFCVVIVKLPFPVPSDPIVEARSELLKEKGYNPFSSYFLPRAVIRFRQGFGRLIRSQRDRGIVLILDQRVLTKNYGRVFLSSLPEGVPVITGNSQHIEEEFFRFM